MNRRSASRASLTTRRALWIILARRPRRRRERIPREELEKWDWTR
jgi:hypothetical protein